MSTLVDYDDAVARYDTVIGIEVHVELGTRTKMFDGAEVDVRRGAEHAGHARLAGPAGRAARGQRGRRRVRDPHRPRAELLDRRDLPVRPEELLLPGRAQELPDVAVRRAHRVRGLGRRRAGRREHLPRRDRARAHGGGRRQEHPHRRLRRPHPRRRVLAGRLQPRGHPAGGDRHQADHRRRRAGARGGPRLRADAARHLPRARGLRGADGARQRARRRQRLDPPDARDRPWAPAPRPRTSTRSGRSSGPCATRSAARRACSTTASRSSRRRATGTRTPAPPRPAA